LLGKGLELLNEGRLTVTGVTADDHQSELALEQRGLEFLVQIGRHVGGLANSSRPRVPALETWLWL
jgi:hypothetical protein